MKKILKITKNPFKLYCLRSLWTFKQTPFKPLNRVCFLTNSFNQNRFIILKSNKLCSVLWFNRFTSSCVPLRALHSLFLLIIAAVKEDETLLYLAKDSSFIMTKSVFISWEEINHAYLCSIHDGNLLPQHCVVGLVSLFLWNSGAHVSSQMGLHAG